MRVTVVTIVGLVASGHAFGEILATYPYLEEEDIRQELAYAAWRVEEIEVPLRLRNDRDSLPGPLFRKFAIEE